MCEPCMVGKSKRSVIPKKSNHVPSNKPNGRVYTDITTIRQVGGKALKRGVWLEIKDEYSKYSTSLFMERKSEMPGIMCQLFSHWKAIGKKVDTVRCDNATENKKFEQKAKEKGYQLGITMEYTARSTPEQNSQVEKSIETKYNRTRACMAFAHVPDEVKQFVIRECITQVTNTSNLELLKIKGETIYRYEAFFGVVPAFARHLHVFGEACIVHNKTTTTKKLDNRGKVMMFVGNSPQHAGNVCRAYDDDTKRVVVSRDAKFINRMYYRSDFTRSCLIPHANDIVLNRLHNPPTVAVPDEDPDPDSAGESSDDDNEAEDDSSDDPSLENADIVDLFSPYGLTTAGNTWYTTLNDELARLTDDAEQSSTRNQNRGLMLGDGSVLFNTGENAKRWRGPRLRRNADTGGYRHTGVRTQEMRAIHETMTITPTAEAMTRVRRSIFNGKRIRK